MADIALRTYLQQVDHHIEQKQFDEAISHCKHILTHYPKNIETYRLLGKALLEKGRHGDAADIFQRVLSAVPDDFVSHVGMAIVREDESNLEAALWHMERAFESSPANPAVQEELRRLYGRRDGVVPPRARLTRGGLARLYARGDLFAQAESELRIALAEDPERLDLRALLARVLAENGQRAQAAEVAAAVLQKLPYNQEANRLLAGLLTAQNRADEARPYQQRLKALDPYERFTDGPLAAPVREDTVRVPLLIYDPDRQAAASPDWAESLGADLESVTTAVGAEEPDWLRLGSDLLAVQTGALTTGTSALTGDLDESFISELPEPGEVPDWMRDVEPVSAPVTAELPDWMKATTGMMATPASDTDENPRKKTGHPTGWLDQIPAVNVFGKPATAPISEAEIPDWLKDIVPPLPAAAPEPSLTDLVTDEGPTTLLSDKLPDWLKTGSLDVSASLRPAESETTRRLGPDDPTQVLGDDELPAWLKNIPPATSTTSEADLPDWLKPVMPTNLDELPPWLAASGATAALAATAEPMPLPGWLESVAPETPPESPVSPSPSEAAPSETPAARAAVELPDFLQPASPEAIERANTPVNWDDSPTMPGDLDLIKEGEVPDWVKALAPADATPPLPTPDLPPIVAEEVPDWLRPPTKAEQPPVAPAALGTEAALPAEGQAPAADEAVAAAPTAEVPVWAEPAPPSASETIMGWLRTKDMPDWIREMRAAARGEAETPASAPAELSAAELPKGEPALPGWVAGTPEPPSADITPPAEPPEAAVPDLSAMSEDDAMRWLESLAARQGADPAELTTTAEERAAFVAPEAPVAAEPAAAEEIPDWLKAMGAPPSARLAPTPVEPVATPPEAAVPDLSAMSEDDAMRWLESLAARQGADPAELTTTAEERAAFAAPKTPVAAEPAAAEEMPDWLKAMGAPPSARLAPTLVEPVATPPEAAVPDLSAMSEDDAMRWLESLAARQGADPAELTTTAEERAAFIAPEAPVAAEPAAAEEIPDWLKAMGAPPTAGLAPTLVEPVATPPEAAVPDLSAMSEDDAMRWLESLAARQGADPAELTTTAEERPDRPPIWITAESETPLPVEGTPAPVMTESPAAAVPAASQPPEPKLDELDEDEAMHWLESLAARPAPVAEELRSLVAEPEPPLMEEPAPEPVIEPPDWVKAPKATPAPTPPELPITSTLSGDDRLARLAERLSASRRAKEAEIAERLERERAEREAAQREVQQRMEERRARRAELGTGTLRRPTDALSPSTPEPEKAAPAAEPAPPVEPAPKPATVRPTVIRTPAGARLTRSPRKSRKTAFPGQTHTAVLLQAQAALQSGESSEALARFEHLIRSGHKLDEVIVELEAYTARHPDSAIHLRLLGDAYMRAGRLQKALDAYREALIKL